MKELMENLLAGVNTRDAPGKDGYIATDGLFYCRKCHTPLQCRMEFFGKMREGCNRIFEFHYMTDKYTGHRTLLFSVLFFSLSYYILFLFLFN